MEEFFDKPIIIGAEVSNHKLKNSYKYDVALKSLVTNLNFWDMWVSVYRNNHGNEKVYEIILYPSAGKTVKVTFILIGYGE